MQVERRGEPCPARGEKERERRSKGGYLRGARVAMP